MPERIIIFTMEKVGSSTVKWALEHAGYLVDRVTPNNVFDFEEKLAQLKIITMVRDPVAHFASIKYEYLSKNVRIFPQNIHDQFMNRMLKKFVDVDLYKYFFDKNKGWQIYDERLLLIRTEDLTDKLAEALTNFLGSNDYLIDHRAKSIDRFGPDYQAYMNSFSVEENYSCVTYDQRYMRHFYTDEEIEGFKQRWLKK